MSPRRDRGLLCCTDEHIAAHLKHLTTCMRVDDNAFWAGSRGQCGRTRVILRALSQDNSWDTTQQLSKDAAHGATKNPPGDLRIAFLPLQLCGQISQSDMKGVSPDMKEML